MTTGLRLTQIPTPFIKIVSASRDDTDFFVLGGIYIPPGSTSGEARLYKIGGDLSVVPLAVGFTMVGKDDSLTLKVLRNGTLRVTVSEAAGATGSGSTTAPAIYDFPNVFSPFVPPSAGVDQTARNSIAGLVAKLRAV